MARTARKPRHRRPRILASPYYTSPAWYRRRARVQQRAGGRCEWCRVRPMTACHHRSYRHFGREPLEELMAVDDICHKAIHGRGKKGTCSATSLQAQGDSGLGLSAPWLSYLQRRRSVTRRRAA